jgi:hypothetical protein
MLGALIEHPNFLAIAIITFALLNYGLGRLALRAESRQRFFERTGSDQATASRSPAVQIALPFVTAVPVAALMVILDRLTREGLGGGYLVMQLATLILNLEALLRARVLLAPGIAEGRVVLSAEYQYRSSAASMAAFAVLAGIVAILFWSLAFAAGGAFLLATATGWYRRARQASRKVGAV